jgi:hypothetical protein
MKRVFQDTFGAFKKTGLEEKSVAEVLATKAFSVSWFSAIRRS